MKHYSVLIPNEGKARFSTNPSWMSAMDAKSSARKHAKLMFKAKPEVTSIEIVILEGNEAIVGMGEIVNRAEAA